ncbi:MAG: RHS repeat domain-containing protein, partial [Armatimonadota bacterium]
MITDSSGAVKFSARYEPYGKLWSTPVSTWKSNLKYIQRVSDSASGGLYCLGVRFYDSEIGRFITEDPVLGEIKSPLTLNRYSYSVCDPINGKDPNGRFFFLASLIGAVVGAVVNAAFYLGECAFGLREFDLVEFAGEIAIGAFTGAITGLTLGLGSASAIGKVGSKIVQIGSKISNIGSKISGKMPNIGSAISKVGTDISKIGSKIISTGEKMGKIASELPNTLKRSARLVWSSISGSVGGSANAMLRGEEVSEGLALGMAGGALG